MKLSIGSMEGLSYIILPAFNLALFKLGLLIRLTRAGTVEVMSSDYVRFARAQGLSESKVVGLHVLKNISIPIVTVFGLELGSTLAFAVVTETVFNWPGMGKLIIDFDHRSRPSRDGGLPHPGGVSIRVDQSRRRSHLRPA